MELWIRSQDKMKLRRVIDLGIFEEQEGYTIYCDDIIDNMLGTYATQERALEVLDEIQEAMMLNEDYDYSGRVEVNTIRKCLIYEMSKD